MLAWLFFGLLLGLQHALEVDHLAAVTALSVERRGMGEVMRHGVFWGGGHALVLGAFGGLVYALQLSLNARLANGLECAVGVMMVLLGARLLYLLTRDRIHIHLHRHAGGDVHLHAHSHAGDTRNHAQSRHAHVHAPGGWKRSFSVGLMHGLAGSAALVALAGSSAPSIPVGVAFIAVFGLGSVVGMALFSVAIAVPLAYTAQAFTGLTRAVQALAGLFAVGVGLRIIVGALSMVS